MYTDAACTARGERGRAGERRACMGDKREERERKREISGH